MHPLFLTQERRAEVLDQIRAGEPTAVFLGEVFSGSGGLAIEEKDSDRIQPMDHALVAMCGAWLDDDRAAAAAAFERLDRLLAEPAKSDLGKGAQALSAVLAWDFGAALWAPQQREAFARRLAAIARSLLEVTQGNPHSVTNNWWMITHAGCLMASMAAEGEYAGDGQPAIADLKAWAYRRFKAFCGIFGDAGLYHEGSGYINYTLSMLMPALVLVERHLDPGIMEAFPNLRLSIASICVGTATFAHEDNGSEEATFGAALQWNDTGRGCIGLNPFLPGMAVAPKRWRGALRGWFDRLLGNESGRALRRGMYSGLPLMLALYPFAEAKEDPDVVLPRRVVDRRQGLGMWRKQWGDGSEPVFGWYARSTQPGGHRHDDAGSIRLMCLRRTWICGGGQNRSRGEWQSIFLQADASRRPKPWPMAHVSSLEMHDAGGVVGLDMRTSMEAYAERYLSWRADMEYPFVLAVMDLLDEHRDPPLDWQWNLSFPSELEAGVDADGEGFFLVDPQCGRLSARFLLDRPSGIEVCEMPASSRTYANGTKVDYPGDKFIRAQFPQQQAARILVALIITRPDQPVPTLLYRDKDIALDDVIWQRPFAPVVLPSVDLATCRPNLMTHPAGG